MKISYTCKGDIRGTCGIIHKSIKAARNCCNRDQRQCKKVRGYSDRSVIKVIEEDGTIRWERLSDSEAMEAFA